MTAVCSILKESRKVFDSENNKIELRANHTYSIQDVDNENVVLFDSVEKDTITLSRETFKDNFDRLIYGNLK